MVSNAGVFLVGSNDPIAPSVDTTSEISSGTSVDEQLDSSFAVACSTPPAVETCDPPLRAPWRRADKYFVFIALCKQIVYCTFKVVSVKELNSKVACYIQITQPLYVLVLFLSLSTSDHLCR